MKKQSKDEKKKFIKHKFHKDKHYTAHGAYRGCKHKFSILSYKTAAR